MLNVTLLVLSIGIQGLVFSRIEEWTYLEGLYFSTVSVLTVGFGDLEPSTTAGKIVLFPLVLAGICQLAVIVSELIEFFGEKTLDIVQITKDHVQREEARKQAAMGAVDLNQEIVFLERVQRAEDNRDEMINLTYSVISFLTLWIIGALVFSRLEGWTFGNGLYFNYVKSLQGEAFLSSDSLLTMPDILLDTRLWRLYTNDGGVKSHFYRIRSNRSAYCDIFCGTIDN